MFASFQNMFSNGLNSGSKPENLMSSMTPMITPFEEGQEYELWEVFHSAIHLRCIHDYSLEQVSVWAPDDYVDELWSKRIHSIRPWVATLEGKVVGYADLQRDGYIDHFFVHGRYQGQGIGSALMGKIKSLGKKYPRLYSNVSISARPFFEQAGFELKREQSVQMRGVELSNFLMALHK